MSEADVLMEIRRIAIAELEDARPIEPEMELVRDLQLDSMAMMTLAVGLEDKFRVRLNEADAERLLTVGDVVALVRRRLQEQERAC